MSQKRFTELAQIDALADNDAMAIDDVSDKTQTQSGSTKKVLMDQIKEFVLESVYPVGCIYSSTESASPATSLGFGTWEAFGAGKVLIGVDSADTDFNAANKTGGTKTHTLTTAQLPVHSHNSFSTTASTRRMISGTQTLTTAGGTPNALVKATTNGTSEATPKTSDAGSGTAHNNLQPYTTVYMWKRLPDEEVGETGGTGPTGE